jgi:hypothetical protein
MTTLYKLQFYLAIYDTKISAVYTAYRQQTRIITFSKNGNAKTMTKILKYISEQRFSEYKKMYDCISRENSKKI